MFYNFCYKSKKRDVYSHILFSILMYGVVRDYSLIDFINV